MKWYRIFRAFQVLTVVGSWFERVTQDGKIDSKEAAELVEELGDILGFEVKIDAGK
jgi:hypothetical protein